MSKINLILSIALTIVFASAIVLGTYDAKNSYIHNVGHYSKGFNTYGPVVTKCNKCFRQFPSEQKSCNAVQEWEKVQKCAFETNQCTEKERGHIAASCILRKNLFKPFHCVDGTCTDQCMKDSACTDFLYGNNKDNVKHDKVSFNKTFYLASNDTSNDTTPVYDTTCRQCYNGTDIPKCGNITSNWLTNPPLCSQKTLLKELENCMENWNYTANAVAKGYISAFKEEYTARICNFENFRNNATGFLRINTYSNYDQWDPKS